MTTEALSTFYHFIEAGSEAVNTMFGGLGGITPSVDACLAWTKPSVHSPALPKPSGVVKPVILALGWGWGGVKPEESEGHLG